MYKGICTFEPEPITEGGIVYRFNETHLTPDGKPWFKTVRIRYDEWHKVDSNVMTEWENDAEVLIDNATKVYTFLKSFRGAPVFTRKELKVWEEGFMDIGLERKGKIPTNKDMCELHDKNLY